MIPCRAKINGHRLDLPNILHFAPARRIAAPIAVVSQAVEFMRRAVRKVVPESLRERKVVMRPRMPFVVLDSEAKNPNNSKRHNLSGVVERC